MTKNYCDRCKKEIGQTELVGMYSRLTRSFSMDGANLTSPIISKQEYLLCEKCQVELTTVIEKIDGGKNNK